ncbi:hypothetical protein GCM10027344_19040 [Spelaeicoccus albus]
MDHANGIDEAIAERGDCRSRNPAPEVSPSPIEPVAYKGKSRACDEPGTNETGRTKVEDCLEAEG